MLCLGLLAPSSGLTMVLSKVLWKTGEQYETTVPIAIGNTEKTSVCSNRFSIKGYNPTHNIVCYRGSFNLRAGIIRECLWGEALAHEFSLRKLRYERQKEICLRYKGKDIGSHWIDYLVEDEVVVELKAVETMHRIYEAQVLTYLRALGKRVGLLINFNVVLLKEGIRRLIL